MRDHRLRERRLKLGVGQYLVGCLAGFTPRGAQGAVSQIERGKWTTPAAIRRVRAALIYLESEPRRQREWKRQDEAEARRAEEGLLSGDMRPVVARLVELLHEGRPEEYDALAARTPAAAVEEAGNRYLEESTPCF